MKKIHIGLLPRIIIAIILGIAIGNFLPTPFGTAVRDLQLHLWRIPQFLHTSYHSRTGYHCHSRYW